MSLYPRGIGQDPPAARAAGLAVLGVAGVAALATSLATTRRRRVKTVPRKRSDVVPARAEARGLHAAASLLALSVLADSATEHYRGSYENPGMYTPLITSGVTAAHAASAAASGRTAHSRRGDGIYGTAVAVGSVGLGFHLFNLLRRPGRLNWQNLFYGAPLLAPFALSLAGLLGLAAERIGAGDRKIAGVPAGRAMAALAGAGLAGTVAEAGLLHFRGAFQNPLMWLPVTVPPVSAALAARAALERNAPKRRRFTRAWLGLTAALGLGGALLHAYGVSRAMGGWRNWRQNMVDGPPLPAPPSFSALAVAALAALSLRDREAALASSAR
ncbi:MAG TPA: hypothetical protein VG407_09260 [Caulobacteraceae bacterium]|jgi:hypothetical protein|nr:hypothetical protein [Caulobacteraceae bacterium]